MSYIGEEYNKKGQAMARPFTPKVVTANELIEGDVIYMTRDGAWVRELCMAYLIEDEAEAQAQLSKAEAQADLAVGAYLADAKASPLGPVPVHFREAFRAKGPSNLFHGKQADLDLTKAVANV
jgi:hypothetical protein